MACLVDGLCVHKSDSNLVEGVEEKREQKDNQLLRSFREGFKTMVMKCKTISRNNTASVVLYPTKNIFLINDRQLNSLNTKINNWTDMSLYKLWCLN